MEEKSRGILLASIPYLGKKRILKVFTAESGLISLITHSSQKAPFTAPFCAAEWVYRKSEKEIFPLLDATLLDPFSDLRQSYEIVSAAGSMANDLLRFQLPAKSSHILYDLLFAYFKRLATSSNLFSLTGSFRLKLLLQDGLFSLSPCTVCEGESLTLLQGESRCLLHGSGGISFTPEEWKILIVLTYGRQFSHIESIDVSGNFSEKIRNLFEERNR